MFYRLQYFCFIFRCKEKCTARLQDNADEIFVRLRSMDTKNEQDVFLQSMIDSRDCKQHRPRNQGEGSRPAHEKSYTYNVMVGEQRHQVCLEAFKSFYGIKISRIRRLRTLLLAGKSPKDLRGKKLGTNAITGATKLLIRNHINSYPLKESKYAGKVMKYLDARLNLKIMYQMFLEKHPNEKCSYKFFTVFFKDNFNLRFGRPQIDCCCTCEELGLKLKSPHLSDAAKRNAAAELMIHRRQSKKFYSRLQSEVCPDKSKDQHHVLAIAFDYMQNMSLPVIPVQDTFYLRQLNVNLFCIHDVKKNHATLYIYHEGIAKKGPNEVCSFVFEYLSSVPNDIKEVHVYSDNCGGQNKNHALNSVFLAFTDSGRFEKIEQFYPIRGHSFLPCDRDFAIVKRALRKHDRLYSMHQLTEIIITSSVSRKFTVVEVETCDIKNFKDWWQEFYKKTCVSEETRGRQVQKKDKVQFGISSVMHFTYGGDTAANGTIVTRSHIDGLLVNTYKLSHGNDPRPSFPVRLAYETGKVHIKPQKVQDIRSLLPYVPPEYMDFYEELLNWPIGGVDSDAEEQEVD